MSNVISPAQALPLEVLRQVVKYMTDNPKSRQDKPLPSEDYMKAMLTVCSSWRQAALEHMWGNVYLTMSTQANKVLFDELGWIKEDRLPHYTADLVKYLRLSVPISDIIDGTATRLLTEFMSDTGYLPHIRELRVVISKPTCQHKGSNSYAASNSREFAELLKSMVQEETNMVVDCSVESESKNELVEYTMREFVNSLYTSAKRPTLYINSFSIRSPGTIVDIPQLYSLMI
ncbi:hypothetical protein GGF42_007248 [Coemansia sp. RSA 2424]|nr:hypothetical protein GGF42_007248 [Coemansia sp. RSA 2424]